MKRQLLLFALTLALSTLATSAQPLRVFIRAGVKTHGPNQHDHPRFLAEWTKLLNERGAKCDGGMEWPTAQQLEQTDVVVMYCANGGEFSEAQKADLDKYLKRGGGIVVIHDAVCGKDAEWFKTIVGGAWQHGRAKWFEGDISLYYTQNPSPITAGASNFDLDDELYYQLDMLPGAKVLAATWTPDERAKKNGRAFPHIYDSAPQMWTYETKTHRAFVSIPGHDWKTFELPHYRAVLLRGIAWAGRRTNVDELCAKEELASLEYPVGGPSRAADSLTKMNIHPDFKVSLVATEPLINKPMNIDWDPAGRLWVAETPEYPNGRRGMRPDYAGKEWKDHGGPIAIPGVQERPGLDRIAWLEDTDKDGVMDKKRVFADGLDLVTGLVFHKDGVIVTQAPDILWLRDTNGDGEADKTVTLYTSLGKGDTHAVINNPRWGFDGWIYATHGYSGSRDVTSGDGSKHFGAIGAGVVRFKPDGSAIEQYSSKGGNTWGLTITWDNEIVWTQPTSGDLVMHTVLSEAQLARGKLEKTPSFKVISRSPKSFPAMTWEQQAYRQIDWVGSFTAAAGTVIYDGGTWPEEYNGDYFTTEPTINVVHHQRLSPDGVSFAGAKLPGREETEFITSRDLWFRPIDVRVGPDGAMYVVDFYNQAVIHNDTRGPDHNKVNAAVRPDRDHYFGRIWKVDHKSVKHPIVPDLSSASIATLIDALSNPNKAVRFNAQRLLVEKGGGEPSLASLAVDAKKPAHARIHALWTLQGQGKLTGDVLTAAVADSDNAVSRNALKLVAERGPEQSGSDAIAAPVERMTADPRLRLAAIVALGMKAPDAASIKWLLSAWAKNESPWTQSAIIAAANQAPLEFLREAMHRGDSDAFEGLVAQLAQNLKARPDDAARLVVMLVNEGGWSRLIHVALRELADNPKAEDAPKWTPELEKAFTLLLESNERAAAVLPLVAAWDSKGALAAKVKDLSAKVRETMSNAEAPDEKRAAAVETLLAMKADVKSAIGELLVSDVSPELRHRVVGAVGETNDPGGGALLAGAFPKLDAASQGAALNQLLKRPDWTRAILAKLKDKSVALGSLGPIGVDRLRNHPDKAVAREAGEIIGALRGPQIAEKDKLLATLLPQVESGGNVENGKTLFATACAVCHKFNGEGSTLAPDLTGMGSHPRAELLTHIVDPNREVDPSFAAWMVETKEGAAYVGIITRESAQSVTIRDQAAEHEVPKTNVKSQKPMERSLMPEGLEALGAEALRDMLAYLESAGAGRFRIIDLTKAVTADGRLGLFASKEALGNNLEFKKYGNLNVGEVPFKVLDPAVASDGKNLVLLKGGHGQAKEYPQRVEAAVPKVRATALHFLGGVAGWGFPYHAELLRDVPAAKVTIVYEGGKTETLEFKNGVEFVDYLGDRRLEVAGSVAAPVVMRGRRMHVFRKPLAQGGVIEKLVLESYDNAIAPVFAAITAEFSEPNAQPPSYGLGEEKISNAPAAPKPAAVPAFVPQFSDAVPQPPDSANGPRALIVGGGSAHDFPKWFGAADKATLSLLKPGWLQFTQNANGVPAILPKIDVLIWSANQPIASETCDALINFADSGKGLIPLHPGTWYAWKNFPRWNKEIVGGGARGHDKFGEFEVEIVDADHPVTAGLPAKFKITDELYHFIPDTEGAKIKVLAQATSPVSGKTYPQVWITEHPKSRIVCITLGHDGKAHLLPEFETLLRNAYQWASGK